MGILLRPYILPSICRCRIGLPNAIGASDRECACNTGRFGSRSLSATRKNGSIEIRFIERDDGSLAVYHVEEDRIGPLIRTDVIDAAHRY